MEIEKIILFYNHGRKFGLINDQYTLPFTLKVYISKNEWPGITYYVVSPSS